MKAFIQLYRDLDQTTRTTQKREVLVNYFQAAADSDKLWATYLLSGRFRKRPVGGGKLRLWAAERAGLPEWLMQETYQVVGDLSETIARVLPDKEADSGTRSLTEIMQELNSLRGKENALRELVEQAWERYGYWGRLVFNKLLTGGFRVGVSRQLILQAIAITTKRSAEEMAHRLMGNWSPQTHTWEELLLSGNDAFSGRPYPFFLAYPLPQQPNPIPEAALKEWFAEWKWDGIRGQLLKRNGEVYLWSRGEELISAQFPELVAAAENQLPEGTVLDGEIVVMNSGKVAPFHLLQTRLNRKQISEKVLREAPAAFIIYDFLEGSGTDQRELPFFQRRSLLEKLTQQLEAPFHLAPNWQIDSWETLTAVQTQARSVNAEGLMLKHRESPYLSGRKSGYWWKWKVAPVTIDAVLLYAQAGHGRRANLYTDFTFALWDGERLVPFAKAYSGLTDEELVRLDKWIKQNTRERFGPVRSVEPVLVFELAFEGVQRSSRHKCGFAVRFPRILRWRADKPAAEANQLAELAELATSLNESGNSAIFE